LNTTAQDECAGGRYCLGGAGYTIRHRFYSIRQRYDRSTTYITTIFLPVLGCCTAA